MWYFWETVVRPSLEALRPDSVVEIGSESGHNTRDLLDFCQQSGARLHSIDPAPRYEVHSLQEEYGDTFVPHLSLSLDALPRIEKMDTVLVDGDHNWYTVLNELRIIERRCAEIPQPFPLVFLHDIGWPYGRRDLYYDPASIPEDYRKPHEQKGLRPDSDELVEEGGLSVDLHNAVRENGPRNGVLTAIENFLEESWEQPEFIKLPGLHGLGILLSEDRKQNEGLAEHLDSLRLTSAATSYLETVEKSRLGTLVRANKAETRARDLRDQKETLTARRDELEKQKDELKAEVPKLRGRTETLEVERDGLKQQNEALEVERDGLKQQNEALEVERDGLKQQNEVLEASIYALRNSRSWRLTMPIRAVKRLVNDPSDTIAFVRSKISSRPN